MKGERRETSAGELAGAGMQFAASIVVFLFAGDWLDRRFKTGPLFVMIGVFVGGGAAFYNMYRKLMASQREDSKKSQQSDDRREK